MSFFSELRHRGVIRAAMFYAAGAWLIVQIATQVFPFFHIAEWVVRWVVIAAVIGFPFAMLFSWFYAWTPQGIQLESEIVQAAEMGITITALRDRFRALLAEHEKIVFKVAGLYGRNAEDQRDLAQEIYAQAWRSFGSYDPKRSFSIWLYRIALNVAISFDRSAGSREKHAALLDEGAFTAASGSATPDEIDERVPALHSLIDQLNPLNRALLLLYLEDCSYRDIAEVLGNSETDVEIKINRQKVTIEREDLKAAPQTPRRLRARVNLMQQSENQEARSAINQEEGRDAGKESHPTANVQFRNWAELARSLREPTAIPARTESC